MKPHIAKTLKARQQWLPTGKDAESAETQEHANSRSLALYEQNCSNQDAHSGRFLAEKLVLVFSAISSELLVIRPESVASVTEASKIPKSEWDAATRF